MAVQSKLAVEIDDMFHPFETEISYNLAWITAEFMENQTGINANDAFHHEKMFEYMNCVVGSHEDVDSMYDEYDAYLDSFCRFKYMEQEKKRYDIINSLWAVITGHQVTEEMKNIQVGKTLNSLYRHNSAKIMLDVRRKKELGIDLYN
jgi:hypothetical protein